MKKYLLIVIATTLSHLSIFSQSIAGDTCITVGSSGNLVVFANYDGGVLNINVDQNIPNLKIGICTYEPVTINLSGTYVNNVTEVRYAGYVSTTNHHCANSPVTTTKAGAPVTATTSVNFLPAATLANPNGYMNIVCAYSCDNFSNQGGCNTADQIIDYFSSTMGAPLYSYYTQYGCWSTTAYNVSAGSNCPLATSNDTTITLFSSTATAVCIGDSINFIDLSPGAASWTWTAAGSNTPTATSQNLNGVTWSSQGTYTVTLSTNDGTGNCSATQTITVFPAPITPTINYSGGILTASPSATVYQWYLNGNPLAGATNQTYTPAQNGVYTVSYIDGNGCTSAVSTPTTVADIGAGLFEINTSLQIYPNPSAGIFQITLPAANNTEMLVEVIDVLGKVVDAKTTFVNTNYVIDLTGEAKGTYHVRISNAHQILMGKIIIQ